MWLLRSSLFEASHAVSPGKQAEMVSRSWSHAGLTRFVRLIIAFVTAALFGIEVKTTLDGLGIGGLAVAIGAQKTLENIVGGVSLLMDKAVHVGDFCQIGNRLGTVEDIGLRSLRLRTLDQNLLVVPNGVLAQMQFENLKARPKLLINQNFSLRIETQAEQLRFVLERVQSMLNEHPSIESGTSRVRVANFAGAAFELELFAYATTGDWMRSSPNSARTVHTKHSGNCRGCRNPVCGANTIDLPVQRRGNQSRKGGCYAQWNLTMGQRFRSDFQLQTKQRAGCDAGVVKVECKGLR